MDIRHKLEIIIKEHDNSQECLRQILLELQVIAFDLELDFDLALVKSDFEVEISGECDHEDAAPYADGSVYCGKCSTFLVKSRHPIPSATPDVENLWRPNG